jgi:DNA-binding SARP family transcriptional activator
MKKRDIRLLGPLQIDQDDNGKTPIFRSQKTVAILGYLIAQEQAVARATLVGISNIRTQIYAKAILPLEYFA